MSFKSIGQESDSSPPTDVFSWKWIPFFYTPSAILSYCFSHSVKLKTADDKSLNKIVNIQPLLRNWELHSCGARLSNKKWQILLKRPQRGNIYVGVFYYYLQKHGWKRWKCKNICTPWNFAAQHQILKRKSFTLKLVTIW